MIKTIHEGYYIDLNGNVYSEYVSAGVHGMKKRAELKKLSPPVSGNGYRYVTIRGAKYLLHRLVYETVNGSTNQLVLHKDGNRLNNRLDNLYEGNHKDNASDTVKHGKNNFCKITYNCALKILKLSSEGYSVNKLSEMMDIPRRIVYRVVKRETWKHITI